MTMLFVALHESGRALFGSGPTDRDVRSRAKAEVSVEWSEVR